MPQKLVFIDVGCGKEHEYYVPVSSGGPYMRVRNAIIG
jgi:hypothetical protein